MRESLKDAAITYVIDSDEIYLKKCNGNFSVNDENTWNGCAEQLKVSDLEDAGLFEDSKGYCSNDAVVVVYRNTDGYDAYLSDDACTNY